MIERHDEAQPSSPSLWREVSDAAERAMVEMRAWPQFERASATARMAGEARISAMAMVKALAGKVEELERRQAEGTVEYRGVWSAGQAYRRGHLVTHHGSIWHCDKPTAGKPGEDYDAWTLAVRRGKDGKDMR